MPRSQADPTTGCNDRQLRPLVPLYAAGPFLFNTSLFTVQEKKSDKNIYNEREKRKESCGETFFLFVCISFFYIFF